MHIYIYILSRPPPLPPPPPRLPLVSPAPESPDPPQAPALKSPAPPQAPAPFAWVDRCVASGSLRAFWILICPFPVTRLFCFCQLSSSVRTTAVPSKLPFTKHANQDQTKRKQALKPLHRAGRPFPKAHAKSIFSISQANPKLTVN